METEFRLDYRREFPPSSKRLCISVDIIAYKGQDPNPQWIDVDPGERLHARKSAIRDECGACIEMYSVISTLIADVSGITQAISPAIDGNRNKLIRCDYSVILSPGLTDYKAQLCWIENVSNSLI
jgi:hypothetical protein